MSATLTVSPPMVQSTSPDREFRGTDMAEVDKQLILQSVGPVQAILDAHDGIVNVVDTTDGIIMISLEGGCTGCSSTPMTAMQIYYSLMKLDEVNDVVFVNGELPAYMRAFIDDKLGVERTEE
jgi:Fe-S cluster biogenesis protein NfuA|tara:strand:- start:123 stop:491 length:369 start_codon:yes stop_codon:yes gene_type:complete